MKSYAAQSTSKAARTCGVPIDDCPGSQINLGRTPGLVCAYECEGFGKDDYGPVQLRPPHLRLRPFLRAIPHPRFARPIVIEETR